MTSQDCYLSTPIWSFSSSGWSRVNTEDYVANNAVERC